MIDWITCKLPLTHEPLKTGGLMKYDENGELEWNAVSRMPVEGSYSSKVSIQSMGSVKGKCTHISFSGNPSKFLQGHGVIGSDNVIALMYDVYKKIISMLDLHPTVKDYKNVKNGFYTVSRVDINYMFELNNYQEVQTWISAAQFKSRTRVGRPVMTQGTIYWGKESRRWTIKAYSKYNELTKGGKKHKLPYELDNTPLLEWTKNKLRIELTLKSNELEEKEIKFANKLNPRVNELFYEYLGRIEMKGQIRLTDKQLLALPNKLKNTYVMWLHGYDLTNQQIIKRSTFYKHRADLIKYGIDISIPNENKDNNIIPLVRIIEAKPALIPEWAYQDNLIHQSAA
jgi:II/X family phage/plasmid replication protein